MERIKIDIISGFLGAGKTTFIKKLVMDNTNVSEKTVILENEFGNTKMDEFILKEEMITVKSVTAGCICCSSLYSFKESLLEIKEEFHPTRIIIEPSGLAKLSEVKNIFLDKEIKDDFEIDHEIIIVDLANYWNRKLISDPFFKDQLKAGKVVFFSKSLTVSDEKKQEIVADIQKINPALRLIEENWDDIPTDRFRFLWDISSNDEKKKHITADDSRHKLRYFATKRNTDMESHSILLSHEISCSKLHEVLKLIVSGTYGEILRIKGILLLTDDKWYRIDYVPLDLTIQPYPIENNFPTHSTLCVIGQALNKEEIEAELKNI